MKEMELFSHPDNIKLDEIEKALLEHLIQFKEMNLSELSRKLSEPKTNIHRRVERLEEERIIESQQIGRQRILSINPAAVDVVRGALGVVPTARVLVLVSEEHAIKIIDYFKPHEIFFLTTNPNADLRLENVKRILLPENLRICYERIYAFIREEKSLKNAYVAIGITGNGVASIAAAMVARDTLTPILFVEAGNIKQTL
jgi:DNA-binding Lrp family transcriptional regulator